MFNQGSTYQRPSNSAIFGGTDPVQAYLQSFAHTAVETLAVEAARFVVVDCETTGLNPEKDAIVSIGAIAIKAGQILLDDQFEIMFKVTHNTASVTVHGVTREVAEQDGVEEVEALKQFLTYLQDSVIVGHHVKFDKTIISAHCTRRFGFTLKNSCLDTMNMTLLLERSGVLPKLGVSDDFSLDSLCRRFSIAPHGRHTAGGDAFITAQIFLILLKHVRTIGICTLNELLSRAGDETH